MKDADDDVRTVAASTLLAIAGQLAESLPEEKLRSIFDTVWHCLANDQDELGSSIGAIMDLLGELCDTLHPHYQADIFTGAMLAYPRFITLFATSDAQTLIPSIYPFRRHPIVSVRLAVVSALHRLATADHFDKSWMQPNFSSYLFENLILEQNPEIRYVSMQAWKAGVQEMIRSKGTISGIEEYYGLVMTPTGQPLDPENFEVDGKERTGGHNVDKAMMGGDLGLVDSEIMWETRIDGAKALGFLRGLGSLDVSLLSLLKGRKLICRIRIS
jgi:TATA-binding protein-associated factor